MLVEVAYLKCGCQVSGTSGHVRPMFPWMSGENSLMEGNSQTLHVDYRRVERLCRIFIIIILRIIVVIITITMNTNSNIRNNR